MDYSQILENDCKILSDLIDRIMRDKKNCQCNSPGRCLFYQMLVDAKFWHNCCWRIEGLALGGQIAFDICVVGMRFAVMTWNHILVAIMTEKLKAFYLHRDTACGDWDSEREKIAAKFAASNELHKDIEKNMGHSCN